MVKPKFTLHRSNLELKMKQVQENVANLNEIHDFLHERFIFKVLGGYYVFVKPKIKFVINVSLILCVFLVEIFLTCMGVYTLALPEISAQIKTKVFQFLIFMNGSLGPPAIRLLYKKHFIAALNCLRSGMGRYSSEVPDEEHVRIRSRRLKQVRSWSLVFGVMCYLSAIAYTIQSPLLQAFSSGQNDHGNEHFNSYLPFLIYMPFNCKTDNFGFVIAFILITIGLLSMFTSVFCLVEAYLSSVIQLLAQIEILNHSLRNIEKRARLNYRKRGTSACTAGNCRDLNDKPDYQRDLYMCLRSNIQHQQQILRYFFEVKEYIGAINTHCLLIFTLLFACSIVPLIKDPLGNLALSTTLITEVIGCFQIFWVGQIVKDTSEETINSLYSTPWVHSNKNFSGLLKLMSTYSKKPIVIRAPAFDTDWTLKTYGDLLSAGYKLVNLLLSIL